MECWAEPYEGKEPYIFVSYCHADEDMVYPFIEKMAANGYRVWYDDGIHPGDDWPEVIASHLLKSSVCIAFLTENFTNSHNCRNELTFAVNNNIPRVVVCQESLKLSVGMKMTLGISQFIKQSELSDTDGIYQKITKAESVACCLGKIPLLKKRLQGAQKEKTEIPKIDWIPVVKPDLGPKPAPEPEPEPKPEPKSELEPEPEPKPVLEPEPEPELQPEPELKPELNPKPIADEEATIYDPICDLSSSSKGHTILITDDPNILPPLLIDVERKVYYRLKDMLIHIGRGENNQIVLNKGTISFNHAEIIKNNGNCFLRDMGSANKTYLNGEQIVPEKSVQLHSGDKIRFADENFVFADGFLAEKVLANKCYYVLCCEETNEELVLSNESFVLGRNNAWQGGAFSDKRASREHGVIRYTDNGCIFITTSKETTNGTFLDGKRLENSEEIALPEKCEIRIGRVYHINYQTVHVHQEESQ